LPATSGVAPSPATPEARLDGIAIQLSWILAKELAVPNQPLGALTLGARLLHDAKELREETTPIAPTTLHGKLVKRELLAALDWAQAAGEMMDAAIRIVITRGPAAARRDIRAANKDLSRLINASNQVGSAAL
jgi:hypothetical protein